METVKKQIFIVGTQRSGTTLLRLILNAHSRIAIAREAGFLVPLLKKKYVTTGFTGAFLKAFYNNYLSSKSDIQSSYAYYTEFFTQLDPEERISLRELVTGLFSTYCRGEGKSIWGNKTPSFLRKIDILYRLFPDALFIHIVRDGRDVFDSWRKKAEMHKNDVSVMALDWSLKLLMIERYFKGIRAENKITVRYEDLLEKPEQTVRDICSMIGVEYEPDMFNFYKNSYNYTISRHSKLIFSPLNSDNRWKWKKNLSRREIRIFNLLAGHHLRKYNYEISSDAPDLADILFMLGNLLVGLPRRFIQILKPRLFYKKALLKKPASDTESFR